MNYEIPDNLITSENTYKPYIVVSERRVESISNKGNYMILKSIAIESGNGLVSLKDKDTRGFSVKSTNKISDVNGNSFDVKLLSMRCAYLFKETGYSMMELGPNVVSYDLSTNSYVLNCLEDVRDEDYVLLLVVSPFITVTERQDIGNQYTITPATIGRFESSWSSMDFFNVQFSPDSTLSGKYTLQRLVDIEFERKFKRPALSHDQPLQAIYSLDLSLDNTNGVGSISLSLGQIRDKLNIDPFSFRLMKVDSTKQEMTLLFEDSDFRGPWEIQISPPIDSQFKLAIFYHSNPSATLGYKYKINYERSLEYNLQTVEELTYNFNIRSISPNTTDIPTFKMEKVKGKIIPHYETIHTLQIIQENFMQYELKPVRHFTFTKNHIFSNVEGKQLPDLNISTIACAYQLPGSNEIIMSTSTPTEFQYTYDLSCLEYFWGQTYTLYIIGQVPIPSPTPMPSTNPIPTPLPSSDYIRNLVGNDTFSSYISVGQNLLFSIHMKKREKLTFVFISFASSNSKLNIFVNIDVVPTQSSYSNHFLSSELSEIEMSKDGILYMLLEGPRDGANSIPFTVVPRVSTLKESEIIAKKENGTNGLIIAVTVVSTILLLTICVAIACCFYLKKKRIGMDQYGRYEKELMANQ